MDSQRHHDRGRGRRIEGGLLTPVTFCWFANPPLADATVVRGASGVFLSRITIIGRVILTGGCLVTGLFVGPRTAHGRPNWSNAGSAI